MLPCVSYASFLQNEEQIDRTLVKIPYDPTRNRQQIREYLNDWINWKNSIERYDMHFRKLPHKFTPETNTYHEGLIMQGLWAIMLAFFVLLKLIVMWLGFSYIDNRRKAQKAIPAENTAIRWSGEFLCLIAFLMFFTGGMMMLMGSDSVRNEMDEGVQITYEHSSLLNRLLTDMKDEFITTNMVTSTQMFLNKDLSLYISPSILTSLIEESRQNLVTTELLRQNVKEIEDDRLVYTMLSFCIGFISFMICLLALFLRLKMLSMSFSVLSGLLLVYNIFLFLPYTVSNVGSLDYCEEVLTCIYDNKYPESSTGLGYYFSDFSSVTYIQNARIDLIKADYEVMNKTSTALTALNDRLSEKYNEAPIHTLYELSYLMQNKNHDPYTRLLAKTVKLYFEAQNVTFT